MNFAAWYVLATNVKMAQFSYLACGNEDVTQDNKIALLL